MQLRSERWKLDPTLAKTLLLGREHNVIIKLPLFAVAAIGSFAIFAATLSSPAAADVVRKTVVVHHGMIGHGCRTVRTVRQGFGGKRVIVRKICR